MFKNFCFELQSPILWKYLLNVFKDNNIYTTIGYELVRIIIEEQKYKSIYFEIKNNYINGYYYPKYLKEDYVLITSVKQFIELLNSNRKDI